MNYFKTNFRQHQKYFQKLLFLTLIGLILGFLIYKKIGVNNIEDDLLNIAVLLPQKHLNFILIHLFILSFLILMSLTYIGLILFPLYFIFEILSISYNILSFSKIFHLKGLIFSLIFNTLTKALYLLLFLILARKLSNLIKILYKNLKQKDLANFPINSQIKAIGLCLLLIILNDIVIYWGGTFIMQKLTFLLK